MHQFSDKTEKRRVASPAIKPPKIYQYIYEHLYFYATRYLKEQKGNKGVAMFYIIAHPEIHRYLIVMHS